MEKKNLNRTVSLTRRYPPLPLSIPTADVTNNERTSSVFSRDNSVSNNTTKLKRSLRLSRKCTFQEKSVIEDNSQSDNVCKKTFDYISKNSLSKKTNSHVFNFLKTRNSISPNSVSPNLSNMSIVQSSLKTNNVDKNEEIFIKKTLKTFDTSYNKLEENDNFVFTRKRGRPSLKKMQLKRSNVVNICDDDEFDIQKPNSLSLIVEKLHNVNESRLSNNGGNNMKTMRYKKSQKNLKKNLNGDNLSVEIEFNSSCSTDFTNLSEAISVSTISSETSIISELYDTNDQSSYFETLKHEIIPLSKRINIPSLEFKKKFIKKSLSVFRENYSESITSSMITLSPIVVKCIDDYPQYNKNEDLIKYKIESDRESVAYEKSNLKDLMDEISKTMPSWSLCTVTNPPRYVISHILIDTYGTPIVSKSIVLDRFFRASVYINQCLEYKYCKRYITSSNIVNLIKDLNDL